MKKICDFITYVAAFAFMLGLCMLDGNIVLAFILMFVSGIWLASRICVYEEDRLRREKQRRMREGGETYVCSR